MLVSNVSNDDGRACAALINAINLARFTELSGKDIDALVAAKKWLHDVATKMAADLQKVAPPASPSGIKIKSMGQLPEASMKPKKTKKK